MAVKSDASMAKMKKVIRVIFPCCKIAKILNWPRVMPYGYATNLDSPLTQQMSVPPLQATSCSTGSHQGEIWDADTDDERCMLNTHDQPLGFKFWPD